MNLAKIFVKCLLGSALIIICVCVQNPRPVYSTRSANPAVQTSTPLNQRVLVVYNANVPESLEVANYYISRRGIPENRRCAISPASASDVDWSEYDAVIEAPIKQCLDAVGRDQILYIVFSYQTPFRLNNVPVPVEPGTDTRTIDQFVGEIWDEYSPNDRRFIEHPYFAEAQTKGNVYQPFVSLADYRAQAGARTIYSVWRLDAATSALARGLVDKAITAETAGLTGQGCFDRNNPDILDLSDYSYSSGNWDLHRAADFTRQIGFPVTEDGNTEEFGTPPAPLRCDNAVFYAGWYSLNNYNDAFTWNPGAIGFHLDSASALDPRGGTNWSANALIRGITVTSGSIAEPYVEGLPHADGVFRNLYEGANVGDAFLRNTAFSRWMIINMGDPLYRPFSGGRAPFNTPNPTPISLRLDPRFHVGGTPATGTITINSPAPVGGATFNLSYGYPWAVSMPSSVTIPAGATSTTFTITTQSIASFLDVNIAVYFGSTSVVSNTLFLMPRNEGEVEVVNCDVISGWAWDQTRPDVPIDVDIYDGTTLLARVSANIFRQGLYYYGVGDGRHGFSFPTPASLRDGQPHSIRVRYAGTDIDIGSPMSLTCTGSTVEPIRVVLSRDASNNLQATITITNPTTGAIPGVQMTQVRASTLDGSAFVDGAPVPQSFGTVNPGQSVVAIVTFPGTAGVPSGFAGLVRVDLSYTGGTYTDTKQVTTP